jgi:predicted DNA-binding transcriptional regulator AlpA
MNSERISFTENEVSEMTGLKVKTLQRWRFLNQGPPFVRLGRCVRYTADDLRRWIHSQAGGGDRSVASTEGRAA